MCSSSEFRTTRSSFLYHLPLLFFLLAVFIASVNFSLADFIASADFSLADFIAAIAAVIACTSSRLCSVVVTVFFHLRRLATCLAVLFAQRSRLRTNLMTSSAGLSSSHSCITWSKTLSKAYGSFGSIFGYFGSICMDDSNVRE
ncbi:hypothetical protein P8452_61241 [Trifolium repens]|nr:hypothetical protein P8452_61241 [Trifolium repens]